MTTSLDSAVDYTSDLPDECLAQIFQSLSSGNRNRCSLVCKRWLMVDARSRRHLFLHAEQELGSHIPSIFSRFDSLTKLTLSCEYISTPSGSINDDDLLSVSLSCPNLTCFKLRDCPNVSDLGVAPLARNCKYLTKLSFSLCTFWIKGLNAVFEHCCLLEELSVKCFRYSGDEPPDSDLTGSSKSFAPLIIGANNLRTLKIIGCVLGDNWDVVLESMVNSNDRLVSIWLENIPQLSDVALSAISKCASLEMLQVADLRNCTNFGIALVAERCKHLRTVHIDCRGTYNIEDEGLVAIGRNCINLKELILVDANPTIVSLEVIASSCRNLELLSLINCKTIRDSELRCLAGKCKALKKLDFVGDWISDVDLTPLFWGFPKLETVVFSMCDVDYDSLHWLKMQRESLTIRLDYGEFKLGEVGTIDGARAQGSMWNVMLFWYFLRTTPYKANQQSSLRSKFERLIRSNR